MNQKPKVNKSFWDEERLNKLLEYYDKGLNDKIIADRLGTTKMAISKQRSLQGLVKFKVKNAVRPAHVPVVKQEQENNFISVYLIDGQRRILHGTSDEVKTKAVLELVMRENNIKEALIYKPFKKLILKQVVEVDL